MIYCGYQGVGKSTYCREHKLTTVDLDSSAYVKTVGWEKQYIDDASAYDTDLKVFISAHKVVIEELIARGVPFEVLIPGENENAWRKRLEFRYAKNPILANLKAIADFDNNYHKDMTYYESLTIRGVKVQKVNARIVTTIENILG